MAANCTLVIYMPIHEVVRKLDPSMCKLNLASFHAFTGCDTVSAFGGKGKKTAWNAYSIFPDVTKAFENLMLIEDSINNLLLSLLEYFVVLPCDYNSNLEALNI